MISNHVLQSLLYLLEAQFLSKLRCSKLLTDFFTCLKLLIGSQIVFLYFFHLTLYWIPFFLNIFLRIALTLYFSWPLMMFSNSLLCSDCSRKGWVAIRLKTLLLNMRWVLVCGRSSNSYEFFPTFCFTGKSPQYLLSRLVLGRSFLALSFKI